MERKWEGKEAKPLKIKRKNPNISMVNRTEYCVELQRNFEKIRESTILVSIWRRAEWAGRRKPS